MASALSMMKRTRGAAGILAKGAIGFGASHLLARHCHGKKDATKIPVAVAAVGKLIPALAHLVFDDIDGYGAMALGAVDAVGQSGVDFLGVVSGLRAARTAKGVKPILVPASADIKALPDKSIADAALVGHEGLSYGSEVTELGALGSAQPGKSLTLDQIRELQRMR